MMDLEDRLVALGLFPGREKAAAFLTVADREAAQWALTRTAFAVYNTESKLRDAGGYFLACLKEWRPGPGGPAWPGGAAAAGAKKEDAPKGAAYTKVTLPRPAPDCPNCHGTGYGANGGLCGCAPYESVG